ncbi:Plant invertase/pectin methylesterase inhibitor superfamily protein [Hibiscus syriacus]|uniref:Plant invertase/pectin methylesterase inhibitor superfamily protein n=1 Tax=Hibiscus syriacus TaxID=106335 RepID=A0A6A2Y4C9_HIBSY|nr:21 kDa protein-like [Hibiscus syriacus]KAE8665107.1 Plant invertase/pectin methylesterase inhibitor superfamily protein [Hibiscus syriacus]
MEGSSLRHGQAILVLLVILQFTTYIVLSSADAPFDNQRNIEYIRSSCSSTTYPRLCNRSLSIYASRINTSPRLLVHTALNVTLKASISTSRLMVKISRIHGLKPRVSAAMADCVEVSGDSVDELQQSKGELDRITSSNFALTISDIQTWVSAALTDEDTCIYGFSGKSMNGYAKTTVRKRIIKIAHLTSKALTLINKYASTQSSLP